MKCSVKKKKLACLKAKCKTFESQHDVIVIKPSRTIIVAWREPVNLVDLAPSSVSMPLFFVMNLLQGRSLKKKKKTGPGNAKINLKK